MSTAVEDAAKPEVATYCSETRCRMYSLANHTAYLCDRPTLVE